MTTLGYKFPKSEKLCGKTSILALIKKGKWSSCGCLRFCYLKTDSNQIHFVVSVSKKLFKRAVKRNLLKRRIREAYRLNKSLLDLAEGGIGLNIMFVYRDAEIQPYAKIEADMKVALTKLAQTLKSETDKNHTKRAICTAD